MWRNLPRPYIPEEARFFWFRPPWGAMACGAIEDRACLNSGKYKDTSEVEVFPDAVLSIRSSFQSVPVKYRSNGYAPVIRLCNVR